MSDSAGGSDYFLNGRHMQNRALPGDRVAIRVLPESEWTKTKLGAPQRTAQVVNIIESKSIKRCAGCFAQTNLTGIQVGGIFDYSSLCQIAPLCWPEKLVQIGDFAHFGYLVQFGAI